MNEQVKWFHVDGCLIPVKKKMRFHKYPNSCGPLRR